MLTALLTLSDDGRAHLALALRLYRNRARLNALQLPSELLELERELSRGVLSRPESSIVAAGLPSSQSDLDADVLTRQQAAVAMGVSVSSIDRLIHRGELAATRVGRAVRIRRQDIEKALETAQKGTLR